MKKRMLCLLLVMVMCLGIFPVPSLAAAPYEGNHQGTVSVIVKDAVTGTAMSGATVMLEDITGGREHNHGTKTTDASGQVVWNNLSSGWYRVIETGVPAGYILNSEEQVQYFDTESTTTLNFSIVNRKQGSLYIYRIDPNTQQGLAGAGYIVTDSTGAEVAKGQTNSDGYFMIPNKLRAGDYTITETVAPNGYSLTSPTTKKVTITETSDEPYIAIFTGAAKSTISIFNYDGKTGTPIGGSTWIVHQINGGSYSGTLTTNSSGIASTGLLEPGTYQITQQTVGAGYTKELKSATITIGPDTENRVVNFTNIKPAKLTVHAGDSVTGQNVGGVSVKLYDGNNTLVKTGATSIDGTLFFNDLPDGHYTVTAEAPAGYQMDKTGVQVEIRNGGDYVVELTATPLGGILIQAVDMTDSTKKLDGCSFAVEKLDGTHIGNFTTRADGTIQVPALETGYYIIRETAVPAGYVMDSATQSVFVSAGAVVPVTFAHRENPYIVVETYIKGTSTPIANSTVSLCNSNGVAIMTGTTGADGRYTFEDLKPDTYVVKYTAAPNGYTIDTPSQTVVVTKGKAGLATLFASRHAAIVLTKLDNTTKAPLPGATFLIRDSLGTPVESLTTDRTGTAASKILAPGRYTVHEQYAPDGYVPSTAARNVEVRNDETSIETFTNKKESAIVVYAYDKDGTPMPNISYILYDVITGQEVATQLTDAAGVAVFEQMKPGSYMVSESVVPDGYIVVNPTQAKIVLQAEKPTYVRFVHVPEATISMETVDIKTGEPITGAVYQITNADGSFTSNYETDANGQASTEALALGTYYVKQIQAPDGYLLDTTTQTITVMRDRINLAKFFNKQMSGIVVECVESGKNFGLTGVTITIENEAGKEVAHGTTTEGGIFTTESLDPGKYLVKVIATPDGYECVQKQRTVEVTTALATSVKFEFNAYNVIVVNLTDAEHPEKGLAGSTFRIEAIDSDFKCEITTDAAGHAKSDALPNGKYMVHQTVAPAGYILDQSYQWATIDKTADTVLDFTNKAVSGLVINALLEGDHTGLAGATFEIWEQNGKLVKTVTTDKSGSVTIDSLASGVYVVKELTVPSGYTARTLTQNVTITFGMPTTLEFYHTSESSLTIKTVDDNTSAPIAKVTYKITKQNGDYVGEYTSDANGIITIDKLPAGTYNYAQTVVPDGYIIDKTSKTFVMKDDQVTVVEVRIAPISGFRIVTTCKKDHEPIQGVVYKITTYNGELVDNYTSNNAGIITLNLKPGKYTIYQVSVPEEFVKNENVWNITIVEGKDQVLEVENEHMSNVVVEFVDKETRAPLYGVTVEIVDDKDNYVGQFKSDNEGKLYLTQVLNAGRYKIKILSVPEGYDMDTIPKTVSVKIGETTKVVWELTGHKGQVTIITYAGQDNTMMNIRKNSPISGAIYQITDTTGKVVGTINGDVNGESHSGVLGLGTYYIQQIVAPSGWQVNTSKFAVTISNTNDNIRVEVYNLAANYSTKISVGGTATALPGGTVKYYFNVENNSTSAMSNFFIHFKIPTDALRGQTLYTGTYSGSPTTLSVEIKTNMDGNYRTIASGLNSKSSYSYGLSSQALGLQNGEYVTDVRLVFPMVVAGFKAQMAPTVQCYVLSTLIGNYQAIMRADCGAMNGAYSNSSTGGVWGSTTGQSILPNPAAVGGQVDNGWVSASSQFTTFVYGYNRNPVPGRLPITGY